MIFKALRNAIQKTPALSLGLDINDKGIDIVEAEKTSSGIKIVNFVREPLPAGAVEDGIISDSAVVSNTIKKMLSRSALDSRSAVTCVRGKGAIISFRKLSEAKAGKLKDVLRDGAGDYLTFAGSDTVVDYISLEETIDEGQKQLRVLTAIARREMIDSHLDVIRRAGCEADSIGIGLIEDLRALFPCYSGLTAVLAIIDDGAINIFLINRGVAISLHSASLAAAEVKGEIISMLNTEIERVLTYAGEFEGIASIEKIILAGDIKGIGDADIRVMEEELDTNIEIGDPLKEIETGQGVNREELPDALTGIGLAMRAADMKTFGSDINLLPREEKESKELKNQIMQLIIGMVTIVVIALVGSAALQLIIERIEKQTIMAAEILDSPTLVISELLGLEEGFKKATRELNAGGHVAGEAEEGKWSEILNEIKIIIPKHARLQHLTSDRNGAISLTGEAASQKVVFNFIKNLTESPYFNNVELMSVQDVIKGKEILTGFNITGELYFFKEQK
ncbi:MAG TPA: hypothetical protein ENH40_00370 [Nitrospirae bacterium]|nr:hypothetical protein [Nitrospirota bacterium]